MNTKNLLGIFIVVGLLIVAVLANQAYTSTREARELRAQIEDLQQQSPQATAEEVQAVVEEVGRLITLPAEETPTLATVSDKDKLKEIPFFAKAETGDKVLIYVKARKAYLYRPADKKLIEVAAINLAPDTRTNPEFEAKVALRNGSGTTGLSKLVEDDLKKVLPNAQITGRDNATKEYAKTIVVALSDDKKAQAQQVAQLFAATVVSLPEGESRPEGAEILVIIGQDVATRAAAKASGSPSPSPTSSPSTSPRPTPTPTP